MGKIITVDRNLGAQVRKEVKLKSGMFSGPYKVEITDLGVAYLRKLLASIDAYNEVFSGEVAEVPPESLRSIFVSESKE